MESIRKTIKDTTEKLLEEYKGTKKTVKDGYENFPRVTSGIGKEEPIEVKFNRVPNLSRANARAEKAKQINEDKCNS